MIICIYSKLVCLQNACSRAGIDLHTQFLCLKVPGEKTSLHCFDRHARLCDQLFSFVAKVSTAFYHYVTAHYPELSRK